LTFSKPGDFKYHNGYGHSGYDHNVYDHCGYDHNGYDQYVNPPDKVSLVIFNTITDTTNKSVLRTMEKSMDVVSPNVQIQLCVDKFICVIAIGSGVARNIVTC